MAKKALGFRFPILPRVSIGWVFKRFFLVLWDKCLVVKIDGVAVFDEIISL